MRVKARQNSGKGADCKEKVKQKKSAGKEENCKICVKRQRRIGKENFYENEVKRQEKSGKAELCEDGVKRQQEAGKAAAGGRIAGSIGRTVAAKQESRNPTGSIRREAARNARRENDNRRRK